MLSVFSPDSEVDADQLECHWGVPVALEMLEEHLISPLDFLELCEETASATAPAPRRRSHSRQHRTRAL